MSTAKDLTGSGPAVPRTRNAERTKARILTAAGRHFARAGYTRVSLQEIANDVGVTPAMVIHHFGSKMELFAAVARYEWGLEEEAQTPPLHAEELAHVMVSYWNDVNARPPSLALVRSLDIPEAVELFRAELERRIVRPVEQLIDGPDREERFRLMIGLVMGFGYFTTGALLDPDAPPLDADESATMERYLARLLAVLTENQESE